MKILVLNSGSSSLKCQYFIGHQSVASAVVEHIGEVKGHTQVIFKNITKTSQEPISNHHEALQMIFSILKELNLLSDTNALDAIGHRVVHGGTLFNTPTLITQEVIETIRSLIPLAPLHNPANLEGIEVMQTLYPKLLQVAVFDTAFHQKMPEYAALYPLPYKLSQTSQIRRYGFHGTSHAYVAQEVASNMGRSLSQLNLITLHLGNGASVSAIKGGISIDTSMGMTPLEGLMMGTRCGDIDPAIIAYLAEHNQMDIQSINALLNHESGLKGICGSNDMRDILQRYTEGDRLCKLALEMYVYRIKKYIGAYTVALGQVDAIVFTGGVGEHAHEVREMICEGLDKSIGLKIDTAKNQIYRLGNQEIHSEKSKIKLYIIPTNEELEIVRQTEKVIRDL
ncbi:MAG: acetate kinase [Campylobacterota bacterium]|nr:acetate kinase [Campylobacterota bacterium]